MCLCVVVCVCVRGVCVWRVRVVYVYGVCVCDVCLSLELMRTHLLRYPHSPGHCVSYSALGHSKCPREQVVLFCMKI